MNAGAAATLRLARCAVWTLIATCLPFADASAQAAPDPVAIRVPRPFAIELGARHRDSIKPDESPLSDLLGAVFAGTHAITHDLVDPARLGINRITFSAWPGAANTGAPVARLTVPLLVLPYGQTPVGESIPERATGSNNAARVLRDGDGTLHLAWLEASAGRHRVMYRRGTQTGADGLTLWAAPAQAISDVEATPSNAPVAMTRMGDGILVAWQGKDGVVLQRIVGQGDAWRLEPAVATGIAGAGAESGVSLAVHGDEIIVLTPAGDLARSSDGGASWRSDPVPVPEDARGAKPQNAAMDVDRRGIVHVVFALRHDDQHETLRYARHEASRGWADGHEVLADAPEWRRAGDAGRILADSPVVRVDARDAIHVAWHGTVNTRDPGKHEVFYRLRPAEGDGWGAWRPVQALWPNTPGVSRGSFAPSLALDATTDTAIVVTTFANERDHWETGARLLRDGAPRGDRIFLSRLRAEAATTTTSIRFPSASPMIHRPMSGGAWLDLLQTVTLPEELKAPNTFVHQSVDLDRLLSADAGARRGSTLEDMLQETRTIALTAAATLGALLVVALLITLAGRRRQARVTSGRRRSPRRRPPTGDAGREPR